MARLPRFAITGQPQHLIQRGNNCQDIFRARIPETDLEFIREATNKAWIIGIKGSDSLISKVRLQEWRWLSRAWNEDRAMAAKRILRKRGVFHTLNFRHV